MSRFDSLSYSRYETRQVLRDRLDRTLRPAHERFESARSPVRSVTDVELLELLVRARVGHDDDVDRVRAAYEAHREAHLGTPAFNDLINEGWFGVVWGRVTTERNMHMPARQQNEPFRAGLQIVLSTRQRGATFVFDDVSGLSQAAQQLAAQLTEHPEEVRKIPAPSPDWIAARLWERRPQSGGTEALRWWVDRWQLLDPTSGSPTTWWAESDARAWRQGAIDVLRHDQGLVAWDREKALLEAQASYEPSRRSLPQIPLTLVERYIWLKGQHIDHWRRALESCGDTWALLALLCEDLVAHDRALEGPSTAELLDLVVERPTLLVLLAIRVQEQPALLADLLLHPPTSALACLMVADWTTQTIGVWDRLLQDAENTEARERAFADAMAIVAHHVRAGAGSIEELAALLVWMHGQVQASRPTLSQRPQKVSGRMFEVVRGELQTLAKPQLENLMMALSFRKSDGLGKPRFTAALDVATFASLTEAVEPDRLVAAYVASLRSETIPYAVALTPAQAASLVLAARRSSAWNSFLDPLEVRERVARTKEAENEHSARDKVARALRAHIRVLSRAIAGWDGLPPSDLTQALASTIRAGSSDHFEKRRVGAFAARYETELRISHAEPPLTKDIAAACRRLPTESRRLIDEALMLIDEPLVLAQLLQSSPAETRERVNSRIDELTPDEAASIQSLTEIQARIEELLNAGATTAAAKYIDLERGLSTLGHVGGRELMRLRWELRIALRENNFSRIAQTEVPAGLDHSEIVPARETIEFYKGLAELSNPSGSASTAAHLFASLARRHPENPAYAVNLFAARLTKVLRKNMFARLDVADIPAARRALNEAGQAVVHALGMGDETRLIHESNKALLLLAMGQSSEAYDVLQQARTYGERDSLDAYGAVALARMGRAAEARASLDASESVYGDSTLLKAAREHLDLGRPGHFSVPGVAIDDNVTTIRNALFQFTQMDPLMQARVVSRETVEAHLTEEVRSAAAAVTAVVPMMRGVQLQEDDVTAVLSRILDARVRFFGWSVPDQSKGGYSARGNPGERDLVLRKDGYVITVLEAVICDSNPSTETTRKVLIEHFQKLVGYEKCRVFFHIVYSYVDRPLEVVIAMRAIATSNAPSAFTFSRTDDLPHEDSRPVGFVATYNSRDGGDIKVVCLIMDMRQQAQREAATLAGQTRASRSKSSRRGS